MHARACSRLWALIAALSVTLCHSGIYRVRTLTGHTGSVHAVAYSPDGATVASASLDGTLRLWNVADGTHRQTLKGHGADFSAVAYSPDGTTLVSGCGDGTLQVWTADGARLRNLTGHRLVWTVAYSPDGTTVVSTGPDSECE